MEPAVGIAVGQVAWITSGCSFSGRQKHKTGRFRIYPARLLLSGQDIALMFTAFHVSVIYMACLLMLITTIISTIPPLDLNLCQSVSSFVLVLGDTFPILGEYVSSYPTILGVKKKEDGTRGLGGSQNYTNVEKCFYKNTVKVQEQNPGAN